MISAIRYLIFMKDLIYKPSISALLSEAVGTVWLMLTAQSQMLHNASFETERYFTACSFNKDGAPLKYMYCYGSHSTHSQSAKEEYEKLGSVIRTKAIEQIKAEKPSVNIEEGILSEIPVRGTPIQIVSKPDKS